MDRYTLKIVIIGNPLVGKSSLRRRYMGESFNRNYIATIGADFSTKFFQTSSYGARISIWDIAGQDSYLHLHDTFYKGAQGALVVYDILSPQSFESVREWVKRFIESKEVVPNSPIVVTGNKIDLTAKGTITEKQQNELIEELKQIYPNTVFMSLRTSAITGENVNISFLTLIELIIEEFRT